VFKNEEEPKDWEIKDEKPPDKLVKKWEAEDSLAETVACASCKKKSLKIT